MMTERERVEAFSKKLLEHVEKSGESQAAIAKAVGVSSSTFSRWCNGYSLPSWNQIKVLAGHFGVSSVTIMEKRIVHIPSSSEDIFDIYVSTNPNSQKIMELTEKIDTMDKDQLQQLLNYAQTI